MSALASEQTWTSDDPYLTKWHDRLREAKEHRKRFELGWALCQAFVQGKQWVGWDTVSNRVVTLPNPQKRVRHTVNVITPNFWTQQGKLSADDLKPDITFRREDAEGKAVANHARRALDYAWDEEFEAEEAYVLASIKRLTYGIGGIRAIFDPIFGEIRDRVPFDSDGQPVLDEDELMMLGMQGTLADGSLPNFRPIREGRILWDPFGPYQTFPPPGIDHESRFPWLIIGRPYGLEQAKGTWPGKAENLSSEKIEVVDTISATGGDQPTPLGSASGELKDHIMVYTGYEMPSGEHPFGRECTWSQDATLDEKDTLPYVVGGVGKAGIVFLKYHMVDGRFWPVGLVEPTIGPQRQRNIARSQNIELKDRMGLGRIYAHDNAIVETRKPTGMVAEVVVIRPGYELPKETQGTGPGPWVQQEADINDSDLRMVVGLGDVSLSQVPTGVSAYSAFALLVEQDDRRIGTVRLLDRIQIRKLVRISLYAIKKYWPPEKHISFEAKDGYIDSVMFRAAEMPEPFLKIPDSAPMPKSQAAEAQLILDIFDRGISSGQPLPLDWLFDSLRSGRAQPLPKRQLKLEEQKAQYEGMLMAHGQYAQVDPMDMDELHMLQHKADLDALTRVLPSMPQFGQVAMFLQQHMGQHMASAAQKQMQAQGAKPNADQARPNQGQGGQNAGMGQVASSTSPQQSAPPPGA